MNEKSLNIKSNVFSMPLGCSFVDELADFLVKKNKDNPFDLANTVIVLPTNRAVRSLKEAFIRKSAGNSFLLPKMLNLFDLQDFTLLDGEMTDEMPAIDELERMLLLANMIMHKYEEYALEEPAPDKALELAKSLAQFFDETQMYQIDKDKLENLVPLEFAKHWQEVLAFLKLIFDDYPLILKKKGLLNIAEKKMSLIRKLAWIWGKNQPNYDVIVAGVTGGMPAVAELVRCVSRLSKGMIILPAVDFNMTKEEFDKVECTHPQFAIKQLLISLGLTRDDISIFQNKCEKSRENLLSNLMLPAMATDKWLKLKPSFDEQALSGLKLLELENEQEEAYAIALILRQVLDTPAKRAIVVTTSRNLGKRITVQMKRWDVNLDDSSGQDLKYSAVAIFLSLLADVGQNIGKDMSKFLALFKHPLTAFGMNPPDFRLDVRKFEKMYRKGKIEEASKIYDSWMNTVDFSDFFFCFLSEEKVAFGKILKAHLELAEKIAATNVQNGAIRLWKGEAGLMMSQVLVKLQSYADLIGEINPFYYPMLFKSIIENYKVRQKYGTHPRLDILGPIEARLQNADVVVVAGLNEDEFPSLVEGDAWMSRQMREQLGLPSKDESIGIEAADFAQAFGAKQLFLTRSRKKDGSPSIPSRWLLRLYALLDAVGVEKSILFSEMQRFAKRLDVPRSDEIKAILPPSFCPPLEARPQSLSVTKIEKWMRDPYSIYAEYVLKLLPLEELNHKAGDAEYGNAVHNSLEKFVKKFGLDMPENAAQELCKIANKEFAKQNIIGADFAFWSAQFERVADWFVLKQTQRASLLHKIICEEKKMLEIPYTKGVFTLTGKIDRIDVFKDKRIAVIDYKTGWIPSEKMVKANKSPQLPLEAMMIDKGVFEDEGIYALKDEDCLEYWKIKGNAKGSEIVKICSKEGETKQVADDAYQGLKQLIELYADEKMPYVATPKIWLALKYSDYEYLERIKEWSVVDEEGEDGDVKY